MGRNIALALLWCTTLASAQEGGIISGVVIRQSTRTPVKRVPLMLHANRGEHSYRAVSGLDGRFAFTGVKPGEYRIESAFWTVKKLLGTDGPLDRRRIKISAETELAGLMAQVSAPALIRGKVSYEDGEPAWAQVTLLPAGGGMDVTGEAVTNSRGEYEIAGVKPGKYYVVAIPSAESRFVALMRLPGQDSAMGYAHSFYPGVSSIQSAAFVAVAEDSEADGIDIRLRPVPLVSLHGTVINSATEQSLVGNLSITAIGVTGFLTGPPAELSASTGLDGGFTFRGVPAGTYLLQASGQDWNINENIEVGAAPEQHTTVYYHPARPVKGLLRMEAAKPIPKSLLVRHTEDSGGTIKIEEDGTFSWAASPGDIHSIRLPDSADPDLYIRSVTLDGRQMSGLSIPPGTGPIRLELMIGSGAGHLSIELTDAEDETKVAVVPVSGNTFRGGVELEKGQDGRYVARRVPPGAVTVLAWDGAKPCDLNDPSTCVGKGAAVTIPPGGVQDVRITAAR